MKMLDGKELKNHIENFSKRYFEIGTSGISGKELDILVFDLIYNIYPELDEKSSFEKSKLLKTTETKIKNLIYEVKLRKESNNEDLRHYLDSNIQSCSISDGKLVMELDDIFFRNQIKDMLKENGSLTDSSFNSDLIKIELNGFYKILKQIYAEKKTDQFKDQIESLKLINESQNFLKKIKIPSTEFNVDDFFEFGKIAYRKIKEKIISINEELAKEN